MRYAVSDIHGCLKTFRMLLEDHLRLNRNDTLFLLGDYIDRGPDSKGVLDYILDLKTQHFNIIALRGNHEETFLQTYDREIDPGLWFAMGGMETLESYGIKPYECFYQNPLQRIPYEHIHFIRQTLYFHKINGYWLVHAGLNFDYNDPFTDLTSCLWKRTFDIDKKKLGNNIIVRGHTPRKLDNIIADLQKEKLDIIGIDAGCVYTMRPGLGYLAALNLDNKTLISVANAEN